MRMITFGILTVALIVMVALAIVAVVVLGSFAGAFLFVFGDVIVCAVLIVLMIKCLFSNKDDK